MKNEYYILNPTNTDFNNLTDALCYFFTNAGITYENMPVASGVNPYGFLLNFKSSNGAILQIYVHYRNLFFVRNYNTVGRGWEDWSELQKVSK